VVHAPAVPTTFNAPLWAGESTVIKSSASRSRRTQCSNRLLRAAIAATPAVAAALYFAPQAPAATLYWDTNGATAGSSAGTTAAGTWDGINAFWNDNSAGTAGTFVAVPNTADTVVFSAGTNATGTSTVTLVGTQTVAAVTVEEGTVFHAGGTMSFGTSAGVFNIASGATYNCSGTGSGFIGGTGGITKTGAGTLLLGGSETYGKASGAILTITQGVADFSGDTALGTVPTAANAAAVTINGGTLRYSGTTALTLALNRGVTIGASGGTIEVTSAASTGLSLPSAASFTLNGAGLLTKTGPGRLTFNTTSNSFTGKYKVLAGSLNVPGDGRWGLTPTSVVADYFTLDGGTLRSALTTATSWGANRGITLGAGGGTLAQPGAGTTTDSLTITAPIVGTLGGNLTAASNDAPGGGTTDGIVILSGTNTYNGGTIISTGTTLKVGSAANVIPDTSAVTINTSSSTFDLNSFSETVGSIAGTGGSLILSNTLTTGGNNNTTTLASAITGTGGLVKNGTGTMTISNVGNSFSGGTTLNAGGLKLTAASGNALGTGNVVINGGTLSGIGTIPGSGAGNALTVNSTAHVAPGIGGGNATLNTTSADFEVGSHLDVALGTSLNSDYLNVTGASGLTLNGGTVHVTTTNGFTDGQYVALKYNGAYGGAFGNLAPATQAGFDSITLVDNTGNSSIDVSVVVTNRTWSLDSNVANDWSIGSNWTTGTNPEGPGAIANLGATSPNNLAHIVNLDADKTIGVLNLSDASGYTVTGTNTLLIDTWGADGQINVNSGSHTIQAPVGLAKLTSVNVVNGSDTLTLGAISNSGGMVKTGAGTLAVSGVISGAANITTTAGTFSPSTGNTYTGKNIINGGAVVVGGDTALGAVPIGAVADSITLNGGTLRTSAAAPFTIVANRGVTIGAAGGTIDTLSDVTVNGIMTGTGNLTKTGSATLTLGAASTSTGKFIINGGVVAFGGGGGANIGFLGAASPTSFTADLLTINGGTLRANNTASGSFNVNRGLTIGAAGATVETTNGTLTFNGAISGSSTITKAGTGILVLASTTSGYTGKYVLNAGELNPNNTDLAFGPVPGSLVSDYITLNGGNIRTSASTAFSATRGIFVGASGGGLHSTSGTMTINAPISGAGQLSIITGSVSNVISLTADNSGFTGSFVLAGGRVNLNNDNAAGAPSVIITVNDAAGQCLASTVGSGTITTANPIVLNNTTAANAMQLQVNSGGTWVQTGQISGAGSMYRDNTGAGTIVLAGNNTFTGGLKIIDRTLTLGHKNALGTNTFLVGDATVAPAAGISFSSNTDLTGVNAVPNAVSLVRNATVNGGTNLELAGIVSGTAGLTKSGTGTLVLSNVNTYSGANVIAQGVLAIPASSALGDGSGTNTLSFTGGTLQTTVGIDVPRNASLNSTGGTVDTAGNNSSFSGVLSGTSSFTKIGAGSLVLSSDNTYSGLTNINAGTLSVASSAKLGDASATNGVAFGGGTLQATGAIASGARNVTLNAGGGTIDTNGNAVTFGNVAGAGNLSKVGVGALTVNSVVAGNLSVTGGSLAIAANGTAAGVSVVNSTAVTGAQLDLSNNHLIDKSTGVGSWGGASYSGLTGLIASGRNGGGWAGNGIVTSQTQATTSNITTLGIATAAQVKGIAATDTAVWAGQTVTGSDSLVMYTYGGDANLDGKINVDDYTRIDFNVPLGASGWYNGDFNYDGKINVDDYTIIDFNVGIQGSPFFTAGGAVLGSGGVSGVTAVPEPTGLGIVTILGAGLMGRRRRKF
jgi:fibronectin-binding autotransporter adhesin